MTMKLVYRAVFIFCIFLVTLCANAFCEFSDTKIYQKEALIYSADILNTDIINDGREEIANTQILNGSISANKNNSSNSFNSGNFVQISQKQLQKLLSYLYSKSYLDNKQKINLSVLSFQIRPNAP